MLNWRRFSVLPVGRLRSPCSHSAYRTRNRASAPASIFNATQLRLPKKPVRVDRLYVNQGQGRTQWAWTPGSYPEPPLNMISYAFHSGSETAAAFPRRWDAFYVM